MEIENSGENVVDGWLLEMQTKPGSTIISHWGAQISLIDKTVYIQPPEQQQMLHPKQVTTFGFCLSVPATTPVLNAGACGSEANADSNPETAVNVQTETELPAGSNEMTPDDENLK